MMDLEFTTGLPSKFNFEEFVEELKANDPTASASAVFSEQDDEQVVKIIIHNAANEKGSYSVVFENHNPAKTGKQEYKDRLAEKKEYVSVAKIKDLEARIAALERS
jgi:hypothetical protein